MITTHARLLELLSLLQGRQDWAGAELADELGVTTRTLRNDVRRLRELGHDVSARRGPQGGYCLEAGPSLPPLMLDEEEAAAIAVGLRAAALGPTAGMEDATVRALAKIQQVLPPQARDAVRAASASAYMRARPRPGGGLAEDGEVLAELAGACREKKRVVFQSVNEKGRPSRALVEPQQLVNTGQGWHLVGWDATVKAWATFPVGRIRMPRHPMGGHLPARHHSTEGMAAVIDSLRARG